MYDLCIKGFDIMKKQFLLILTAAFLFSCNGPTSSVTSSSSNLTSDSTISENSSLDSTQNVLIDVLNQLKTPELCYEGSLKLTYEDGTEVSLGIKALASSERKYLEYFVDGQPVDGTLIDYYCNKDGFAVIRSLNPFTNSIDEENVVDSETGENVVFADNFSQPFLNLEESTLTLDGDEVSVGLNENLKNSLSGLLTGYGFISKSLTLTLGEDGVINSLSLVSEEMISNNEKFIATFDFVLKDKSEMGIPELTVRPSTAESAALQEVLSSLKKNNYSLTSTITYNNNQLVSMDEKVTEDGFIYNIPGAGTAGVLKLDNQQYVEVMLSDNKLEGLQRPVTGDYADLLPSFGYLANMFDFVDGKYVLPNIEGLYYMDLYSMLPENIMSYSLGLFPNPDTFAITLTSSGAEFTYNSYLMYGIQTVEVEVKTVVSSIGTTELGYDIEDYLPFKEAEAWSDVKGGEALLAKEKLSADILPFINVINGRWQVSEDDNTLSLLLPLNQDPREIMASYGDKLSERGWKNEGVNPYGQEKWTYQGNGYLYEIGLGVVNSDNSFVIYLYEPTISSFTDLTSFIDANFSEALNYTFSGTMQVNKYLVDIETEEISETPIDGGIISFEQKFTEDGATLALNGFVEDAYINTENGSEHYQKNGDSYQLIDSRAGEYQRYYIFTLGDLVGNMSFEATGENTYQTVEYDALICFADAFMKQLGSEYDAFPGESLKVTLNSDNTLKVEGVIFEDLVEEDGNYYLVQYVLEGNINNIGSTEIDLTAIK